MKKAKIAIRAIWTTVGLAVLAVTLILLVPFPTRERFENVHTGTVEQQTLHDRVTRIADSFVRYRVDHREHPKNRLGADALSWRVFLLPYLGENELFKRFNLSEAWDGPTNKSLINQMPSVYQGPYQDQLDLHHGLTVFIGLSTRGEFLGDFEKINPRGSLREVPAVMECDLPTTWTKPDEPIAKIAVSGREAVRGRTSHAVIFTGGSVSFLVSKEFFELTEQLAAEGTKERS